MYVFQLLGASLTSTGVNYFGHPSWIIPLLVPSLALVIGIKMIKLLIFSKQRQNPYAEKVKTASHCLVTMQISSYGGQNNESLQ